MTRQPLQQIATTQLMGLPNNPRKITQKDLNILCDSIRINGFYEHRPIAAEKREGEDKFIVLDGNQRLKAARRLKMKTVPVVIYSDLTEDERIEIITRGNINNGTWDVGILQADYGFVDFQAIGLQVEFPEPVIQMDEPDEAGLPEEEDEDLEIEDKEPFFRKMLGDFIYPSDNAFEIPTLLMDNQPVHLELPFTPWGVESRHKKGITTYHFYVDDYRFERLFKDPINLLLSGCKAIVEPNCSIHDQTPIPYGIYQIYRKRYLARYFQECGVQVWADLNVSHRFEEYNRLGIPDGYNAFFTRGVTGWIPNLERNLQMAQRISGLDRPNMCVYGGGKDIEEWCHQKGITYLAEFISHMKKPIK